MKYDELLKEAKAAYPDEGQDACFAIYGEGDKMGIYTAGPMETLKAMLEELARRSQPFAELLLDVTSAYGKNRMVVSVNGKDAMRQAYEETKKPS